MILLPHSLAILPPLLYSPRRTLKSGMCFLAAMLCWCVRYSAYKPKFIADAYISSWNSNTFTFPNSTLSCLGTHCSSCWQLTWAGAVYRTHLVACLNTLDLAVKLELGETIKKPPFNDICFQVAGICGIPCFENSGPYPSQCRGDGVIDPSLLSTNESMTYTTDKMTSTWASSLNEVEWVVLLVIFLDTFCMIVSTFICFNVSTSAIILKSLPFLSGRPTEVNSTQPRVSGNITLCWYLHCINVLGCVVLGTMAPFSQEDHAIFLRNLLGRTTTIFKTICINSRVFCVSVIFVDGKHDIHGAYLDVVLNEERSIEGRQLCYDAWMAFLIQLLQYSCTGSSENSLFILFINW